MRKKPLPAWVESLESRVLLAAGDLVSSFGNGGKATTDFVVPALSQASAVIALPGGKTLAVGNTEVPGGHRGLAMVQFRADGKLDDSFGTSGRVVNNLGGDGIGFTAVRLDSGKIVVAGAVDEKLAVARFNSNGSLDVTFGANGIFKDESTARYDGAAIRVAADGSIIAAALGNFINPGVSIHLIRLTPNGTADRAFGSGGTVEINGLQLFSLGGIELRSDGRIVIGGACILNGGPGIFLMQFTASGQPDAHFAKTGRVVGKVFFDYDVTDIALDNMGRILLLNNAFSSNSIRIARFRGNGTFDRSFGHRGIAEAPLDPGLGQSSAQGGAMAVQPDGRIVAVGRTTLSPVAAAARLTDAGELDQSFAEDGVAEIDSRTPSTFNLFAVALRSDGAIVAAGALDDDLAVVRLEPDGSADATFASGGIATVALSDSGKEHATAMALLPDGGMVVVGSSYGKFQTLASIARYRADGSLETTFGDGGRIVRRFGEGTNQINTVAALADGKILVGGSVSNYPSPDHPFLARFNPDGSLDQTFGENGIAPTASEVLALRVLPGGKFLVVENYSFITQDVHRFNADGTEDLTFQDGAQLRSEELILQGNNAMTVQPNGKIIFVGAAEFGYQSFIARRINADGSLDTHFGDGGTAQIEVDGADSDQAFAVMLQRDGKILIAGSKAQLRSSDYAVVRLNPDGTPDASFGNRGVVTTAFPPRLPFSDDPRGGFDLTDYATAIAIQGDGKIILAGSNDVHPTNLDSDRSFDFGIIRYNLNGSLDTSFGNGGRVTTDFGGDDSAVAATVTDDGRLVIAGTGTTATGGADFALAQYDLQGAGSLSARLENGILKITGTDAADIIRLKWRNGRASIDSVGAIFDGGTFGRIEIEAKGGDDLIDASGVAAPVRVDAGAGNDVVLGGSGADVLLGNAGNDTIFGGGGGDILRGSDGNDYLNGGPGADQVFGDAGNDQVFGVDGAIDSIDGGDGFDRVKRDRGDLLSHTEGLLA
jgi:uncharacterized delta-60 repeat protein